MRFIEKITYLVVLLTIVATSAAASTTTVADSVAVAPVKRTKAQLADSASRVIRVPSEGARVDRGIYQYLFIPKGQVLAGATLSYAHLDSDDSQFMLMIDGLQADCSMTRISPFIGVSYAKNQVLGARFAYQLTRGKVDNVSIQAGDNEDYTFTLSNVDLRQRSYAGALFHRAYIGLDLRGRFALYNETRVEFAFGRNEFSYGQTALDQYTKNRQVGITFHPGVAVCIMNNVSMHASVGIGGVRLSDSRVYDGAEMIGKRTAMNANFRLNLLDISLGITLHL
jgi:opacity protein-like surface antigen